MPKRKRANGNGRPRKRRKQATARRRIPFTVEVKHFDASVNINIVSAGAVRTTPLNGILEGLSQAARIGARINITKVMFRGHLSPAATTDDGDVVRVIFFQDKQCSGTTPDVADILSSADEHSFRTSTTTKRFVILADFFETWSANSLDVAGTAFVEKFTPVVFFKDTNIPVQYTTSAATFAAISTNSIGVLTISREGDASNLVGIFRCSFTDV